MAETRIKSVIDVEVNSKASVQMFADLEASVRNLNKLVDK